MSKRDIKVVGIDLAGVATRPTGICCLFGNEVVESRDVRRDESILHFVAEHNPQVVAIDAPLCLPPGRRWTPGTAFPADNGVHFRKCDLELRARGIRFFPITLGPMRSLTMRGIVLKRQLEKSGYRVIEIYPGGAQDIWGIARKQQGLALLRRGLRKLGIEGIRARMSGHELDAISGAIVGRLFLEGQAEVYGDFKSGAIVMPTARRRPGACEADSPGRKNVSRNSNPRSQSPRFSSLADVDVPELESMVMALYREDPTGQNMSLRKIRRTVAELSAHPDKGSITIVRVGDAVVGYVIVIDFWSNEYGGDIAHIDELYVRPPWRNKGIGARCLEHVAGMKGGKLEGVRLEVTPANRRALAFYSRHGFKLAKNRHMFRELS